jgi:hypothetical protein
MDKTSKIIGVIALCLIIILFVYIGFQHRKVNKLESINQLQAVQLSVLNDTVSVYKSKSGDLTFKLTSVEIERNNLKESLEIAGFDIKKLKSGDIEWRRITNALKLKLETVGSGTVQLHDTTYIHSQDSTKATYFNVANNYLTFDASIINRDVSYQYYYRTGIEILQTPKRSNILVSVSLMDPNAAITSANSITITHKNKWWEKPWLWGIIGFGTGVLISK